MAINGGGVYVTCPVWFGWMAGCFPPSLPGRGRWVWGERAGFPPIAGGAYLKWVEWFGWMVVCFPPRATRRSGRIGSNKRAITMVAAAR